MRLLVLVVGLSLLAASSAPAATLLDDVAFPQRWQPDQWNKAPGSVAPVPEAPEAAGEGSLAVSIDWPADDEFRFVSLAPETTRGPIPYRLQEVSLWVKAAGDPHFLELHFKDAKGADAKIGFGALSFTGWQHLTRPVPAEWPQPLTLTSLTWHNWGLKGAGGSAGTLVARLEGVLDETSRLAPGGDRPDLLFGPGAPYGIADETGQCPLSVRLLAWRRTARRLVVEDDLFDGEGRNLGHNRSVVDFTGEHSLRFTRPLPRCGCFRCALRVSEAEGQAPLAQAETHLVRLAPLAPLTEEERRRSAIGVNTHLGAPWPAFERLGIHWARDYSWGWLGRGETAPVGNGRDFAAVAAEAARCHVNVLPVTQGAFRNKAETGFLEDSAAISTGFERLARAFPKLRYWEIDNEYEYALRDKGFSVADYRRALRAASEGLRRAGAARLVLNGTAGIQYDLAAELLSSDARDAFAVVNSHFYTGAAPPETGVSDVNVGGEQRRLPLTALDQLRRITRLAHEAGKESWLTEIGWDVTNGPAVGERLQALYLPRVYLLARAVGVDKVFWFYDRDVPGSTTIFSTCGLLRLDGSLRPSAVAMAALSRETARGEVAGSLDLGEDVWAVVLRQPEGTWTLAAWSVLHAHPVPKELAGVSAVDVYGNPLQPGRLTPAVTYFHLARLPVAWDLQRQACWESSSVLVTCPGGSVAAAISAPSAKVRWADLPTGVASAGWHAPGDRYTDTLTVAPAVAVGRYPLTVMADGDGWQRAWHVMLVVEPPLQVAGASAYEPNQAQVLTVSASQWSGSVSARLLDDGGTVAPASFPLQPGATQRLAVVPSAQARGVLRVEFSLTNGARQESRLYPLRVALPRLAEADAAARWPDASLLPLSGPGGSETRLRARLAWAPEGLRFAVELPAAYLTPGKPETFWDSTNVELFLDPERGSGGWSASCRQFWFTPVREGDEWRLVAGQWQRGASRGSAPETRGRTNVVVGKDAVVLEGLVPPEVLGRPPQAGESWRCAVSVRGAGPDNAVDAGWPRAKSDGLLSGPGAWGIVGFE